MRLTAFILLLLSAAAQAEVYKCVADGKTTYADRPCDAAALPAVLPPLNTIQRKSGDDLAKRHDERLSKDKKARDVADAEFVKQRAAQIERDQIMRKAIIDHRVIKGMTPSEVESALGAADEKLPDGGWRYRRDGQRVSIGFKEGEVSSVSTTSENKKK